MVFNRPWFRASFSGGQRRGRSVKWIAAIVVVVVCGVIVATQMATLEEEDAVAHAAPAMASINTKADAAHISLVPAPAARPQRTALAAVVARGANNDTTSADERARGSMAAPVEPSPHGRPPRLAAQIVAWEWLQREVDIFATFEVGHYRPKDQPNAVHIVHRKTGEENWTLFKDSGAPFSPVLMAELDAIKKTRIAGLTLRRDWDKQDPDLFQRG
jgi:hypothetical protein